VAAGFGIAVLPKCCGQIVVRNVVPRPLSSTEAKSYLCLS
jgi:hypothetical protein